MNVVHACVCHVEPYWVIRARELKPQKRQFDVVTFSFLLSLFELLMHSQYNLASRCGQKVRSGEPLHVGK